MQQPNILDVVRAVTAVAPDHPEVRVWWYSPEPDLRVKGDESSKRSLDFVLEFDDAAQADSELIAADLSARLNGNDVTVREHRGREETVRLFRMLTTR